MDENLDMAVRQASVEYLVDAWENFHQWAPREYLPHLQATWDARRRIRVGGGTLLGVGEILRLLRGALLKLSLIVSQKPFDFPSGLPPGFFSNPFSRELRPGNPHK